jgi:hypothetical protein
MNSPHLASWARAVCVGLVLLTVHAAIPQSNPPTLAPAQTAAAGSAPASDAAEKHVKRTACFKDAKAKKLVGAQRNAYIKSCVAAPPAS